MPPSDPTYIRASERKRARSEKRQKKKHLKNNKTIQKRSNSWTTFSSDNGDAFGSTSQSRKFSSSNAIKTNGKRRKRSFEEKEESFKQNNRLNLQTSPASINTRDDDGDDDLTTPLLGSHKKKSQRQKIDFVYPRSHGNVQPLPFDLSSKKVRQKDEIKKTGTSNFNTFDMEKNNHDNIIRPSKESIEDILYSSKKKKQKKEKDQKLMNGSSPNMALDKYAVPEEILSPVEGTPVQKTKPIKEDKEKTLSKKKKKRKEQGKQKQNSPENAMDETDSQRGQLSGLSVQDAVRDKAGCRPRSNSTDGELNLPRRGLCDEHAVLESHRWNTMSFGGQHAAAAPPRGFINLGNTCYLNSTLQCLFHLPTFCQSLLALPPSFTQSFNSKKVSSGQKMTDLLRTLIRKSHNLDTADGKKGSAIAPRDVVRAVPTIGAGMSGGGGYKFRPGRQEDAHEFLVHLLDAMKDGELKAAGINQRQSGWRDRLPIPRLDETTLIHRIFGGYLRSQVRCTSCNYRSNTYDPFMDLALEVSKKSSNSIASAFSEFARKEKLDSANRWKCSGCKKHVCALKQLTVFRPPLSLCIQLKRFTFGGGFGGIHAGFGHFHGGGRGGSKISKPIEFPAELKLPLSDGRICVYTLTGIVIHVGGSASSGHYTAYVKRPGTNGKTQWYHMDDSFVEAVSEKTVLRQRDAYVLFYCRKEVKLEFTTPVPRGSMSASEAKQFGENRARARANSMTSDNGTPESPASSTSMKKPSKSSSDSLSPDEQPFEKQKKQQKQIENPTIPDTNHSLSSSDDSSFAPGSESESDDDSLDPPDESMSSRKESLGNRPGSGNSSDESPITKTPVQIPSKSNAPLSANGKSDSNSDSSSESSSDEEDSKTKHLPILPKSNTGSSLKPQKSKPASSSSSSESSSKGESSDGGFSHKILTSSKPEPTKARGVTSSSESSSTDDSSDSDRSSSSDSETKGDPSRGSVSPNFTKPVIPSSQSKTKDTTTSSQSSSAASDSSDSDESSSSKDNAKGGGIPAFQRSSKLEPPSTQTKPKDTTSSSESSSDSDSSDSDESSSSMDNGKGDDIPPAMLTKNPSSDSIRATKASTKGQQKVVLDRGKARGRVEVVVGQRGKKKGWKPKSLFSCTSVNGVDRDLLGSVGVGKWDDNDDDHHQDGDNSNFKRKLIEDRRSGILKKMEKQEKLRKRKMHLDKWDSALDEGRTKKVKTAKKNDDLQSGISMDPKKNQFQRIQSSIQRMQRGRAKGLVRQQQQEEKQQQSKKTNFRNNGGKRGATSFRRRK